MKPTAWTWFGTAGHFICAHECRFHMHTHVGRFCISSVGDHRPRGSEVAEEIGSGRLYETMVFDTEGETRWTAIESDTYNTEREAADGHMAMCRKYARTCRELRKAAKEAGNV